MKKILFVVGLFAIVGCNKNREQISIEKVQQIEENGYIFPEGTRFVENYDEKGKIKNIDFYLPDGYTLFGVVNDEIVKLPTGDGGGSITCDCNDSGGCSPIKYGNRVGCEVKGCKSCVSSSSIRRADGTVQELDFFFIQHGEKEEGNFDDEFLEDVGFAPIKDPREWVNLPFLNKEDIYNPDVEESLREVDNILTSEDVDRNSPEVGVLWKIRSKDGSFKKGMLIAPYDAVKLSPGVLVVALPIATKCSGTCKEGSCTASSSWGVVTCEGCSSGCTLHY